MKLFYICPHFSTGGMPAYVLKQIECFKDNYDITVVEVNNYGDLYVVHRNKLINLVQLNGNQQDLLMLIDIEKPDILHFQEVPECFIRPSILKQLYKPKRDYKIVVTTHTSVTRRNNFIYIPDRIVAVNNWQKQLFDIDLFETSVEMWEYPIENRSAERLDFSCHDCESGMIKARNILNFEHINYRNEDRKHILNVGLFTPGKNQGELFEVARKNPQNIYHFVGNQAPNFEHYWKPLMKNKPENCIIWGEREDVDLFYKACDEMYFTSKFELNPICVKEALSYGLPVKMYRLHTYGTDYDNNPLVTYL